MTLTFEKIKIQDDENRKRKEMYDEYFETYSEIIVNQRIMLTKRELKSLEYTIYHVFENTYCSLNLAMCNMKEYEFFTFDQLLLFNRNGFSKLI